MIKEREKPRYRIIQIKKDRIDNFVWSAMNNFEWINGYGRRLGIVLIDFKTQKRTSKMSSHWLPGIVKRNAVI